MSGPNPGSRTLMRSQMRILCLESKFFLQLVIFRSLEARDLTCHPGGAY